ncbi:hypothetical protein J6Q66_03475 [bacterium]|nr:hypothetical protein [bacterium]
MIAVTGNYGSNVYYQKKGPTVNGTVGAAMLGACVGLGLNAGGQKYAIMRAQKSPEHAKAIYEGYQKLIDAKKLPKELLAKIKEGKIYWKQVGKCALLGAAAAAITHVALECLFGLGSSKNKYVGTHQG